MKKAGRKATRSMERVAFCWLGKPSEETVRHSEIYFALKWERKELLGKGDAIKNKPKRNFCKVLFIGWQKGGASIGEERTLPLDKSYNLLYPWRQKI